MNFIAFRTIEAAVSAIQVVIAEVFDCSPDGSAFDLTVLKMADGYPELERELRALERSLGHYENTPSLFNTEGILSDAKDLLDLLDPNINHFDKGDPYAPEAIRRNRPELATKLDALKDAIANVENLGGAK